MNKSHMHIEYSDSLGCSCESCQDSPATYTVTDTEGHVHCVCADCTIALLVKLLQQALGFMVKVRDALYELGE